MKQIYSKIIHVHFKWGGEGYITVSHSIRKSLMILNDDFILQRSKIKSRIKVFVKTLHGKRLTHKITIDIMSPLEKVKERLYELEPEEMSAYRSIKLIYPMGKLRTLALEQTPAQLNLMSGARLLLQGTKQFKWDTKYKSSTIQLSDSD